MSPLETRQVIVGGQTVEIWESPDARFDLTPMALRRYLLRGAWVTLFNAIALQSAPLREA
jgi:hypothetical protein